MKQFIISKDILKKKEILNLLLSEIEKIIKNDEENNYKEMIDFLINNEQEIRIKTPLYNYTYIINFLKTRHWEKNYYHEKKTLEYQLYTQSPLFSGSVKGDIIISYINQGPFSMERINQRTGIHGIKLYKIENNYKIYYFSFDCNTVYHLLSMIEYIRGYSKNRTCEIKNIKIDFENLKNENVLSFD